MFPASSQSMTELREWLGLPHHEWLEVECPICQSAARATVRVGGRYGLPVRLVQCRDCGQLYQSPQLLQHGELIKRFYHKLFASKPFPDQRSWDVERRRGERALEFVAPVQRLRCHDIGCGSGGLVALFNERGHQATGSDVYEPFLEFGRRRGADLSTALPEGKVDLVSMINVLHYLPDLQLGLSQILGTVKLNGLVYIEGPGVRRWLRGSFCRGRLGRMNTILHLWHFDLEHLEALLSRHGFILIRGDQTVRALFQRVEDAPFRHPPSEPLSRYIAMTRKYSWLWWALSFLPEKMRLLLDRQSARGFLTDVR
jgi:SAM-dependent methyltransferase